MRWDRCAIGAAATRRGQLRPPPPTGRRPQLSMGLYETTWDSPLRQPARWACSSADAGVVWRCASGAPDAALGARQPRRFKGPINTYNQDQLENSDAMDNRSFRGRQVDSVQGQGEGPHTCHKHKHNELHNDRVVMEEGTWTCNPKQKEWTLQAY